MRNIKYNSKTLHPFNTAFLVGLPLLGIACLILHIVYEGFNPYLLIPAFIMYLFTTFSISGGYHRLFAHRTYRANKYLKIFYLLFGGASGETSALDWSTNHRRHHQYTDTDKDPHSILEGFFFSHIGWVLLRDTPEERGAHPKDLLNDPLVMWQHNNYLAITMGVNIGSALLAAYFTGSFWGSLAMVAFLRLTFVHHITFFINSLCHMIGTRPYNDKETARDSHILALVTFGEGYHNFHHAFQSDYRNGLRWYQWDPTKWALNLFEMMGAASDLKRTSEKSILAAKMEVIRNQKLGQKHSYTEALKDLHEKVHAAQKKWLELKAEYQRLKDQGSEKVHEMRLAIDEAKREFQMQYHAWLTQLQAHRQHAYA